jgi:hypothetical protein
LLRSFSVVPSFDVSSGFFFLFFLLKSLVDSLVFSLLSLITTPQLAQTLSLSPIFLPHFGQSMHITPLQYVFFNIISHKSPKVNNAANEKADSIKGCLLYDHIRVI